MRHVVGDLLQRLVEGSKVDPQSLLWGILIGACLLSLVHLVTMFATRWGDHRVTGKALLFSLMLHFGCLIGVVTVAPAPSLPPGDPEGGEQSHRVMIRSVAAQRSATSGLMWVPPARRRSGIAFTRPVLSNRLVRSPRCPLRLPRRALTGLPSQLSHPRYRRPMRPSCPTCNSPRRDAGASGCIDFQAVRADARDRSTEIGAGLGPVDCHSAPAGRALNRTDYDRHRRPTDDGPN